MVLGASWVLDDGDKVRGDRDRAKIHRTHPDGIWLPISPKYRECIGTARLSYTSPYPPLFPTKLPGFLCLRISSESMPGHQSISTSPTFNTWPPGPPANESELDRALRQEEEREAKKVSDAIDDALELEKQEKRRRRVTKILLLGEQSLIPSFGSEPHNLNTFRLHGAFRYCTTCACRIIYYFFQVKRRAESRPFSNSSNFTTLRVLSKQKRRHGRQSSISI